VPSCVEAAPQQIHLVADSANLSYPARSMSKPTRLKGVDATLKSRLLAPARLDSSPACNSCGSCIVCLRSERGSYAGTICTRPRANDQAWRSAGRRPRHFKCDVSLDMNGARAATAQLFVFVHWRAALSFRSSLIVINGFLILSGQLIVPLHKTLVIVALWLSFAYSMSVLRYGLAFFSQNAIDPGRAPCECERCSSSLSNCSRNR
jgi:hypothetical protein